MEWEKLKTDREVPREVIDFMAHNSITTYHKYCKWLEKYGDELLIRTFAFKEDKKDGLLWTEVERAIPGEEFSVQKNIYLTSMSGYRCVFKPCRKSSSSWYGYNYYYFSESDFDVWYTNKALPGWMGHVINLDLLFTLDKYKYCGFSQKQGLKEYLEFYNEDHDVEFFGKLGLVYQKSLARDAKKDKQFRKFIAQNAERVNTYRYTITRLAYKNHVDFTEAEDMYHEQLEANRLFRECNKTPYKVDKVKIFKYVRNKLGYNYNSYRDYWNACVYIGLDMRDTKNSMPNEFKRMHDIRIDEYASAKIQEDLKKNKAFNKKLKAVAKKYELIVPSEKFLLVLPTSKGEFIREGDLLHHCVGKMGYDTKMHDEKILIGFIRLKDEPNKPYVTAEYDLHSNRILQMHGDHNAKPDDETAEFIEEWAKLLKKGVRANAG